MNRHTKFDAASFILGGEIRNCTNKQTVKDISTPCLSAGVDKNKKSPVEINIMMSRETIPDLNRDIYSRGGNTARQAFNRQNRHLEPLFRSQSPPTITLTCSHSKTRKP